MHSRGKSEVDNGFLNQDMFGSYHLVNMKTALHISALFVHGTSYKKHRKGRNHWKQVPTTGNRLVINI